MVASGSCTAMLRHCYKRRMAKGLRGQQDTWRAGTGSQGPSLSGGISPFWMLVLCKMEEDNAVAHWESTHSRSAGLQESSKDAWYVLR